MDAGVKTTRLSRKEMVGWILTIICTAGILFALKDSTLFNWQQTIYMAITVFYIFLTAFELVPNMVIAILLPFTYLFFKLAPATMIFNAWSNNVVWMCVCGMISANILGRIGLLHRLIYWCVMKIGTGYRTLILAFTIVGIILTIIADSGGYIIFAALVYSFCKTLNLEGTNVGKGLMLTAACMITSGVIYEPGVHGVLVTAANAVDASVTMDYVTYFIHNAPMIVFYFVPFFVVPILFKQDVPIEADLIKDQAAQLGKMSSNEKKALVITFIFLVAIMTTSVHHIGIVYCFVAYAMVMYLPFIQVGQQEDIKKVNYSLIFFISAFISIGSVAANLGFNEVLSTIMTPMLSSGSNIIVYMAIYLFGLILNLLMTPLAAIAAFTAPLTQVAIDLGLGVYPTLYAFQGALREVFLPYEIAKFLVFYAYGLFTFSDFAKLFGIKAILHLVYLVIVMIPYWSFLGLT